ncbi:SCP2 sterol-binding domain-containing protein [Zoogloeaceae bacterium G21618-S1]|nr:SCP2 sterol-binding domain-containing protein [Zoogloeaceae bacterium G21618-S1]
MLSTVATGGINHLLAQADWARKRLREHQGAVAAVTIGGVSLSLAIGPEGYVAKSAPDVPPSVTITLAPDALAKLPDGIDAAMSQVKISGQADLADSLSFVFRHLRWDSEADMARIFGPIIGHRAHRTASHIVQAIPDTGGRIAANASEYLAHEGRLLVPHAELLVHAERLRHIRDTMSRLDKRIKRLTHTDAPPA